MGLFLPLKPFYAYLSRVISARPSIPVLLTRNVRSFLSSDPAHTITYTKLFECKCHYEQHLAFGLHLYLLGLSLSKKGRRDQASRLFISATVLYQRARAKSIATIEMNGYGMPKRRTAELDDFYAFYSIQACRYFQTRSTDRFHDCYEKNFFTGLIAQAWNDLRSRKGFYSLSIQGKVTLFNIYPIEHLMVLKTNRSNGPSIFANYSAAICKRAICILNASENNASF